jgi:hypothetical protein
MAEEKKNAEQQPQAEQHQVYQSLIAAEEKQPASKSPAQDVILNFYSFLTGLCIVQSVFL